MPWFRRSRGPQQPLTPVELPEPLASQVDELLESGLDVKTVQHRLRHGSATTTLNTYGHLWPDRDEATRAVVGAVLRSRPASGDHLR